MMKTHRFLVVLAGVCLALAPAGAAHAAVGAGPTCGTTLTENTTLTADLTCSGDALVIGADAITLDLGGHTVRGDGTGTGIVARHLSQGSSLADPTIRNGTVRNFATAVRFDGTDRAALDRVRLVGVPGTRAFWASGARYTRITASDLIDVSMTVDVSIGFTVTHSRITRGVLGATDTNEVEFSANTVTDARVELVEDNYPVVANNRLVRSPLDVDVCDWVTVRDNWITGADVGITIGTLRGSSTITGNVVSAGGIGLSMNHRVPGLTVERNAFTGNGAAGAVLVLGPDDCRYAAAGPCVTLRDNAFIANGYRPGDRAPLADGLNLTVAAGQEVLVSGNRTVRNARYGIWAQPGSVVDGGGNVSIRDGAGCVGVACR